MYNTENLEEWRVQTGYTVFTKLSNYDLFIDKFDIEPDRKSKCSKIFKDLQFFLEGTSLNSYLYVKEDFFSKNT